MKQVSIRNIVIPSRSRSGNYPTGSTVIPGGGGSNATIDLSKYMKLALWLENFEAKTDTDGNQYIYAKKPLVSVGGFIAYCSDEAHVPSIFEGIPIDNDTIYWDESTGVRILKAKGSDGGSDFDATAMWAALSAATNEQINKSHLTDAFNGYATESWVEGKGYALQTSLDAVSAKLNDFLEGSDTDTIINKWKELEAFLSGMQETDNLAEILSNKADTTELAKYVTLATEQEITGLKHFINGLSIGATKHKIYEQDGVVYFDGDLAVTGGITAYAKGDRTPSSILDGLIIDETTLSKEGGKLSVIGGVGGASNWDELEGKPSWIGDTKPSYNWSEIGSKPTTLGGYGITANDVLNTLKTVDGSNSGLDADLLDGKHATDFSLNGHTHTFASLTSKPTTIAGYGITDAYTKSDSDSRFLYHTRQSGIDADLISTSNPRIYEINNGTHMPSNNAWHQIFNWGSADNGYGCQLSNEYTNVVSKLYYRLKVAGTWGDWFQLARVTDNVASATKLQTPRTIWGQGFDGTVGVSGSLFDVININASGEIRTTNANAFRAMYNDYGFFIRNDGYDVYFMLTNKGDAHGNWNSLRPIVIHNETGDIAIANSLYAKTNGNVGIDTTSPSYKLDVDGDIHANYGWLRTSGNYGWYSQSYGGGWYMIDSTYIRTYGGKKVYSGNGYLAPYSGSYWISMATRTGIIDGDQNQSSTNAHALYRVKSYSGHAVCFGGLGDNVGFYGFYKSRIDANENGTDWSTTWDATNGTITHRGNFLATGGITCYASDQRAKTVIEQINLSLKQIANAPTIRFKWNNWKIKDDGKTHIGGIAQYMQKLLPETVLEADDMLNMDYATTGYIFAVQTAKHLVKTDTEVERLKKRVKKLEKQLKQLGYKEVNIMDD